jgi:hypothetical protein
MVDLHEGQQCFRGDDGYMYCNFVVRRGKIVRSLKGWMKFFVGHRKQKKLATV